MDDDEILRICMDRTFAALEEGVFEDGQISFEDMIALDSQCQKPEVKQPVVEHHDENDFDFLEEF